MTEYEQSIRFEGPPASRAIDGDLLKLLTNGHGLNAGRLTLECDPAQWNENAVQFLDTADASGESEEPPQARESDESESVVRTSITPWDMNDDGYRVVQTSGDYTRTVTPDTRLYHTLALVAIATENEGGPLSSADVSEQTENIIPRDQVSTGTTHLRRAGLLTELTGKKRHLKFVLTRSGVDYLSQHGEPTAYDLPADTSLAKTLDRLCGWAMYSDLE